jgi:hypothetical protein
VVITETRRESSLAAKLKRQLAPLKRATSTPKTRVWSFENTPSGRPCADLDLSWENAMGSVQYTYRNASGRAEWLSRDPLGEGVGSNLYGYVSNNPVNFWDPLGLTPGDQFSTLNAAAVDALNYSNPDSISENTEYGGTLYQNANGTYSASLPTKGSSTGVNPLVAYPPQGTTLVGDYHTHGDYSKPGWFGPEKCPASQDAYKSDSFSPADKKAYQDLANFGANKLTLDLPGGPSLPGYQIPVSPNYNGYLGTPSGQYLNYSTGSGLVSIVPH